MADPKGKVLRFWRGARRQPRWQLAVARPRRVRRGPKLPRTFVMAAIGLLALPPLADIANAVVKPAEGCRVWGVIDGDTVRLHCPGDGVVTGRLLGFDTPEKQADCPSEFLKAMAATQYLRWQLLSAATISTRTEGRDRYGRRLTVLLLDGQDVAEPMVEAGLARWYDGGRRAGWCGQERSLRHV